jgi:hypothetical protein
MGESGWELVDVEKVVSKQVVTTVYYFKRPANLRGRN